MSTLYQVQVCYPDTAIQIAKEKRGEWLVPTYGANGVKRHLSSGRAALTRYRNENRRPNVEYRLVELSGEWTEVDT